MKLQSAGGIITKKFYTTTAIPYVNAPPHIGHALEFIQTDVLKRFHELEGKETFLTTGADENSLKNVRAAEEENISVKELCNKYAEEFKKSMILLDLSFDSFVRSSSEAHSKGVTDFWKRCEKDIYKKKYKGLYCVGCEAFYTEDDLVDGKCPEHLTSLEIIEEENYFFKLSKYEKKLKELIEKDKLKIVPETRKNEVLSFIGQGLEDFSISRSNERARNWGITVPGDDKQKIYVWFDALNCYQTGVGFGSDDKKYNKWWPCDVHVIGKGIIRFHAIYWPAMLLSAGLKLPKELFVHGYITINGQKISKSLGNVINPISMVEKYGADQIRYYMVRDISPFHDGDFSEKGLVERVNEELVSNFSNLFYRVTSFIEKNFNSVLPEGKEDKDIKKIIKEKQEKYKQKMESFRLNEALEAAVSLSGEGNAYFQSEKPWVTVKSDKEKCANTMYNAVQILAATSSLLYPIIPKSAEKALAALGAEKKIDNIIKKDTEIIAIKLFEPISLKEKEIKKGPNIVTATILEVEDHPKADKLYVLQIDLGKEKRQLVAGLKGIYEKDELKGKQILVVANLKKAKLRGVESNGMLLACEDGTLIRPKESVDNGTMVCSPETKGEITIDEFCKNKFVIGDNNSVLLNGEALKINDIPIEPEKPQEKGKKIC
ncbi:methionine--tRNA ligase [Candidatus Aenigmatarchaeota archaeon]